jgi:hypothetical protein
MSAPTIGIVVTVHCSDRKLTVGMSGFSLEALQHRI